MSESPWFSKASEAEQQVEIRKLVDRWYAHIDESGCADARTCPHLRDWIQELIDWRDRRSGEDLAAEIRRIERILT